MKRRSFLSILGLAPLAPAMVAVAAPAAASPTARKASDLVLNDFSLQYDEFGRPFRAAASRELVVEGSITADKIVANAVTANQLSAGSITASKIDCGSCVVNRGYLQPDGSYVFRAIDLVSGKFV